MIAFQDPLGQLPEPASTFAADIDPLFYFLFWVSLASFALILGALVYSAIVHRRKTPDQAPASNVTHSTTLEVVWTLVPTIVVMVAFAWGLKGNLAQQVAPGDALQYRVEAWKWAWAFYHPGSTQPSEHLWVPIDTPVKFTMTSRDVLHSFYVPAMRVKRDVVPGVRQIVWFQPNRLSPPPEYNEKGDIIGGGFDLFCAEYCGDGHSLMHRRVFVVSREDYEKKPWDTLPDTPEGRGEYYYKVKGGCAACHRTDDQRLVGPGFKGIWMREGRLADGSSYVADDAYIHESIRKPSAKIVQGYGNAGQPSPMPVFTEGQLTDEEIADIITWMKTLK